MSMGSGFSLLPWDSDFFGLRIGRVMASDFTVDSAAEILDKAREESVDCLYLLVDARDSEKVQAAENSGFRLVDVRITRERDAPRKEKSGPIENIDQCHAEDIPGLQAIARRSHRDSRFYHDPNFPNKLCDALYEAWIENACNGASACVIVARSAGRAVGYVTCDLPEPRLGVLGLVAVAEDQVGKGFGGLMVEGALEWMATQQRTCVRVVTQARNINASRLYEANGFKTVQVENSYHLWPRADST
jgi:ribosomal protein S18 acetylase RimI-like enzyme